MYINKSHRGTFFRYKLKTRTQLSSVADRHRNRSTTFDLSWCAEYTSNKEEFQTIL